MAPISVVIPAYNAESFIEEAIRSVQLQTLQVSEIIVIADDCSDRTREIALDLGARVLEHKRRNMSAGLNLGVSISKQPWIALLDADDYWDQNKIALQWKAIETFPEVAIVSCDLYTMYPHVTATTSQRRVRERWNDVENVLRNDDVCYAERVDGGFLVRFFLGTPTVILRRDVFSSVGLFDEDLLYGQTLEFFARVLARYPLAFVERPLVYQRVHDRNHTNNFPGCWTSYLSIVDRMLRNPELYATGAGEAHREFLKRNFLQAERLSARWNGSPIL
jgi:glycosyltransferase involved in cell wall biosynthesis